MILHIGRSEPVSPSGPIIAKTVVKRIREHRIDRPMVQKMKIPNCWKKIILAANMKIDDPSVVQAPEKTEIPT
jgi:hypothetical protein